MAEEDSGRRIGQGGLSGPLGPREKKDLYPNQVRPDRTGYPPSFAPPAEPELPAGESTAPNSTDLDIGLLLVTDPAKAMEVLAGKTGRKGEKKDTA